MKLTQIFVLFAIFVCFLETTRAQDYGFRSVSNQKPNNLQACQSECERIEWQCSLEDVSRGRTGPIFGVSYKCHLHRRMCDADCEKKFRNHWSSQEISKKFLSWNIWFCLGSLSFLYKITSWCGILKVYF